MKFVRNYLCWSLFNKAAFLYLATLLKKKLHHRCVPISFVKCLRMPFYRTLPASECCLYVFNQQNFHCLGKRVNLLITYAYCIFFPFRSSRPEVFSSKGVLKNVGKFTVKHLCPGLLWIKLPAWLVNLFTRVSSTGIFPWILRNL